MAFLNATYSRALASQLVPKKSTCRSSRPIATAAT